MPILYGFPPPVQHGPTATPVPAPAERSKTTPAKPPTPHFGQEISPRQRVQCARCAATFLPKGFLVVMIDDEGHTNGVYDDSIWKLEKNGVLRAGASPCAGALITPHGAFYCAACGPDVATCRVCGCTEENCTRCVQATGEPCYWTAPNLCSACAPDKKPVLPPFYRMSRPGQNHDRIIVKPKHRLSTPTFARRQSR